MRSAAPYSRRFSGRTLAEGLLAVIALWLPVVQAQEVGADGFMSKPVNAKELLAQVRALLGS